MAEVFLSYAQEDAGRAKALAAALERAGRSVWWDRNIEGGSEYSLEIDEELKSADAVVVLWSSHSVGSAWVRDEAAAGRDSHRLVPVRLDNAEPPLGFRQFQTIDLSRWKGRDGPGLKTLKSAVAAKVARSGKPGIEPAAAPLTDARRRRWVLVALAAAILAVAALAYVWTNSRGDPSIPAIAIVRAPSGGDAAKSDAMARALSVELGAMGTGSIGGFELRDTAGGKAKDVDYLVEVAAAQNGGTASADLSLLSSAGRQIVWTSHFEKPANAQGDLRLSAATRLLSALACLAEASASGDKLDQPSLKLYLRVCEKFGDSFPGLADEDQYSQLRQVNDRAPRFAPALAHLALIEANIGNVAAARQLIDRTKALDPKLGKIYLAELQLLPPSQWKQRQAYLTEGLRRNPDNASLHDAMAFELTQVGRRAQAIVSARRAVELNPVSPHIRNSYVFTLAGAGRLVEAEREIEKAEIIWPDSEIVKDARYAFELRLGNPVKALRMLEEKPDRAASYAGSTSIPNPGVEEFLKARINPTKANIDQSIAVYMARFRRDSTESGSMLLSLGVFGRTDEAYALLAHPEVLKRLPDNTSNLFRFFFKQFRADPRFMPLAARLGLVRYWTETGKWPDFCFEPDLPYDCKREATRLRQAGATN